jgi:importin subunit beta-1
MAIEGDFDRYTSIVLGILKQAGEVNMEDEDEDLNDYINSLRIAIMEAYTGIIQGLKEANKEESVVPALDAIVELLQRSTDTNVEGDKSEEVLKAAIGLLGDLGQIFGARVAPVYRMPFVSTVSYYIVPLCLNHIYQSTLFHYFLLEPFILYAMSKENVHY